MSATDCAQEPIHIPGSIQPHGMLLVLEPAKLTVLQASENLGDFLAHPARDMLGRSLAEVLGTAAATSLGGDLVDAPSQTRPVVLRTVTLATRSGDFVFNALAHRTTGGVVLELEPAGAADASDPAAAIDIHAAVDGLSLKVEAATSLADLSGLVCREVRRLTGFDRVLVYRFDVDWNGTVVGEDGNGQLPSYLHHRFPASDIPAQARELYRTNRIRIIPDASYRPVAVVPPENPVTGQPLDMSLSSLRSVSRVHVEYMRNMETASSMSISILREGRLWGLIACHHHEPKAVAFPIRGTCDLFARAFSLRLSALEHTEAYERRLDVRSAYSRLLAMMANRGDFAAALAEHPRELLSFAAAGGAAVLTDGGCVLVGETPDEGQVRLLADWLFESDRELYATDHLCHEYPSAAQYKHVASGVLAIEVSKLHASYVLWFRPEVVRTTQWSGEPIKHAQSDGEAVRLHPRRSFATWLETVRDRSTPWSQSELDDAGELRNAIVGTVLKRAEELAELNEELCRSNKELEAFSYSVSHDLRAPLRHIVGYAEMLREGNEDRLSERDKRYISTIIESSEYAGRLVDKLLAYSRLGRAELQLSQVDMNTLVEEVQRDVMQDACGRNVSWHVAELPSVEADLMMLRMAVRDLASNAVKYTRKCDEAVIEVGGRQERGANVYWVKDNGVGFDMAYADKLFGVFQRLHRWEDFEGTGIGLANVRRVIERHGGRTWAEGEEGRGATFFFALPSPRS